MERLTFEGNFCEIARCGYPTCPYKDGCSQKQVWERLKRYEDTKRTPEQIEALEAAIMGKAVAQITEFEGLPIARLRELAVADQEGRVIVLPCKVGGTVYAIVQVFGDDGVRPRIIEKKITGIGGNALNKVWMVNKGNKYEDRFSPSEFGRTVFLTREEAEKALAETGMSLKTKSRSSSTLKKWRENDGKKNLRPMRSRNKPYKFGNVCKRKGLISRKHGRRRALLFMRDAHS